MPELSNCLGFIAPSRIGEIFNLAKRLAAEGRTIYDLSSGEPDFDTDSVACDAGHKAIDEGNTKYTETDGSPQMKAAVRRKFIQDGHTPYTDDQIAIGNGAKPLLANILMTLLNPVDEALIPGPCWTSHPGMVQILGATAVIIPCMASNDYKLTADQLRDAISPSGSVYNKRELRALADVLVEHPHVWIVSDEIYSEICFDDRQYASIANVAPELLERIITVNGVSKGYAMTGWRIGYAAGSEQFMGGLRKLMSQIAGSPSSISQAAAIAALDGPQSAVLDRRDAYQSRRDFVVRQLSQVPELSVISPQGAFYVFVDCKGAVGKRTPDGRVVNSSADLTQYFLEKFGVAVVPGEAFETENAFRLSFATSPQILEGACAGMVQACRELS